MEEIKVCPFKKTNPNSVMFNFANGLHAVVEFNTFPGQKKSSSINELEYLFSQSYWTAKLFVYKECGSTFYNYTDDFMKGANGVSSADMLIEKLEEVRSFSQGDAID